MALKDSWTSIVESTKDVFQPFIDGSEENPLRRSCRCSQSLSRGFARVTAFQGETGIMA